MIAVDSYRTVPQDHPPPDAPVHPPSTSSTSARTVKPRYIPPAVPSPPQSAIPKPRPFPSRPPSRPELAASDRTSNMASEENSQWLFTDEELIATPSALQGLQTADEQVRRAKGVNFLVQVGICLKLPQLTIATAAVFFHRYFMRLSMYFEKGGLHHYNVAATAIFLATKTEENCRKTKEIVAEIVKVALKKPDLLVDDQMKEFWKWRDVILKYEEWMLEQLTFEVVLTSPYNLLFHFLQDLGVHTDKNLRNVAWAVLNDSSFTMMCLRISAKHIACVAIFYGLKFADVRIPDNGGRTWWEQLNCEAEKIVKGVEMMNDYYASNPLNKAEPPPHASLTPASISLDGLEETRALSERRRSESYGSSQNGAAPSQQNGATNGHPTLAANATTEIPSAHTNQSENDRSLSEPVREGQESIAMQATRRDQESSGSTDRFLKEAANDVSSHTARPAENAVQTTAALENKVSPKRKAPDDVDVPEAKRPKTTTQDTSSNSPSANIEGATGVLSNQDAGMAGSTTTVLPQASGLISPSLRTEDTTIPKSVPASLSDEITNHPGLLSPSLPTSVDKPSGLALMQHASEDVPSAPLPDTITKPSGLVSPSSLIETLPASSLDQSAKDLSAMHVTEPPSDDPVSKSPHVPGAQAPSVSAPESEEGELEE